jgi:limonene-1,2-epoxide hydrolase
VTISGPVGARQVASLRQQVVAILLIGTALAGCATAPAKQSGAELSQRAVIENYMAALNRRDLLPLTAYVTPDFEWLSMVNGERVVEVTSREALADMLRVYFERNQNPKWRIESVSASGNMLAVTERVEWIENGSSQSRNSLGVYELQDGRIRRVTYFLSE